MVSWWFYLQNSSQLQVYLVTIQVMFLGNAWQVTANVGGRQVPLGVTPEVMDKTLTLSIPLSALPGLVPPLYCKVFASWEASVGPASTDLYDFSCRLPADSQYSVKFPGS